MSFINRLSEINRRDIDGEEDAPLWFFLARWIGCLCILFPWFFSGLIIVFAFYFASVLFESGYILLSVVVVPIVLLWIWCSFLMIAGGPSAVLEGLRDLTSIERLRRRLND